jgi:hypothetical protein
MRDGPAAREAGAQARRGRGPGVRERKGPEGQQPQGQGGAEELGRDQKGNSHWGRMVRLGRRRPPAAPVCPWRPVNNPCAHHGPFLTAQSLKSQGQRGVHVGAAAKGASQEREKISHGAGVGAQLQLPNVLGATACVGVVWGCVCGGGWVGGHAADRAGGACGWGEVGWGGVDGPFMGWRGGKGTPWMQCPALQLGRPPGRGLAGAGALPRAWRACLNA